MKRIAALLCVAALALPFYGRAAGQTHSTQSPLLSKLHWRNVGPFIGGRVVAVAGVPQNPNLFYMGAVDGGVWRSTDYGNHWENLTDGKIPLGANSIGAIAVAPSDPNVIYVGTGEGVYKSTDAGKTWRYAGLRDTHTTTAIAIDPRNSNVVYVSSLGHVFKDNADRGVFKTTDGGKTWSKVLYVDAKTGANDVVIDQKSPDTLYATMWQMYRTPWKLSSGGPGSGIYKSTDAGAHWTKISGNPGFAKGVLGKMGVAVSPADSNVVYAIAQAHEGGVFRSSNGGSTWTRVNDEMKLRQRALCYMDIVADPKDPNNVYSCNSTASGCPRTAAKPGMLRIRRTATTTSFGSTPTTRTSGWKATTAVQRFRPTPAKRGATSTISRRDSSITLPSTANFRTTSTARSKTKAPRKGRAPRNTIDSIGFMAACCLRREHVRGAPARQPERHVRQRLLQYFFCGMTCARVSIKA